MPAFARILHLDSHTRQELARAACPAAWLVQCEQGWFQLTDAPLAAGSACSANAAAKPADLNLRSARNLMEYSRLQGMLE